MEIIFNCVSKDSLVPMVGVKHVKNVYLMQYVMEDIYPYSLIKKYFIIKDGGGGLMFFYLKIYYGISIGDRVMTHWSSTFVKEILRHV